MGRHQEPHRNRFGGRGSVSECDAQQWGRVGDRLGMAWSELPDNTRVRVFKREAVQVP